MKIKEVEKQLSISSHALRYYEKMHLIHPHRDENGYRDYNMQDIDRLKKIRFLRELEIPIEDIAGILDQSTNFQTVLEHHIQKLDTKIASLQYIQQICQEFQDKGIPVLDVLTQEQLQEQEHIDKTLVKQGLKKLGDYLRSQHTTVIGTRIQIADYLTGLLIMIALSIGLGFVFGDVLPRMIGWVNSQYHLSLLTGYSPHLKMFVLMTIISLILILSLYHIAITKQDYIELTDQGIQICSRQFQSRYSILIGFLLKQSERRNQHYQWQQLKNVSIDIVISTMTQRYGLSKIYLPRFTFTFDDGQVYTIKSGLAFDENSKMAYQIIKAKHIPITGDDYTIGFYKQDKMSGFEYFEKHYAFNTPRKK